MARPLTSCLVDSVSEAQTLLARTSPAMSATLRKAGAMKVLGKASSPVPANTEPLTRQLVVEGLIAQDPDPDQAGLSDAGPENPLDRIARLAVLALGAPLASV